jgi:NAD(P)-dependent dehydrogenase (short-subunit alcohol dehydrogenase family)
MRSSYVVTGGGRGIGRVVVEHLVADDQATVVVVDHDPGTSTWLADHPAADRLVAVAGDAADPVTTEQAADRAEDAAPLVGWVNNAAIFRDASLDVDGAPAVLDLVHRNLAPMVAGCATAVRRFLAAGTAGSIVNVSSHQARRPVPGALPYATAKAAIEGLTRALAVDHGPAGIRANAVALGSIRTGRYDALLAGQAPADAAATERQMAEVHPLGRVGEPDEVAEVVAFLLGDASRFVTGAVLPVDGGRSVLGPDPEARRP